MNHLRRPLLLLATVTLLGSLVALAKAEDSAAQSQPPPPPVPTPIDDSQVPANSVFANAPRPDANPSQSQQAGGAAIGTGAGAKPTGQGEPQPSTAALIIAGLPKYDPPKPVPAKPADQDVDLRDVDKPQNEIVRLPAYYVRTARQAVLKEPDLVSQTGMADIGMKNYPGLALTPFAWLNAMNRGIAKEMYLEDRRLQNISDLNESAISIGRGGDSAESEFIKKESQDTFLRPIDWGGLPPK